MEILIREAVKTDIEMLVQCHGKFMEHHINVDKHFALRPGAEKKMVRTNGILFNIKSRLNGREK